MPITRRSIGLCIVLSIVTCGIYSLYWLYCLAEDIGRVSDPQGGTSGGMVLLLSIVTCGIYMWYWLYKSGEMLDQCRVKRGGYPGHLALLYLLLGVFGLSIISFALMQSELNEYAA